jgi:hypothetical protein
MPDEEAVVTIEFDEAKQVVKLTLGAVSLTIPYAQAETIARAIALKVNK